MYTYQNSASIQRALQPYIIIMTVATPTLGYNDQLQHRTSGALVDEYHS